MVIIANGIITNNNDLRKKIGVRAVKSKPRNFITECLQRNSIRKIGEIKITKLNKYEKTWAKSDFP